MKDTLSLLGFTPKFGSREFDVYLYRESEVYRYAKEIEFHNPYHDERLRKFKKHKAVFLGRSTPNWHGTGLENQRA